MRTSQANLTCPVNNLGGRERQGEGWRAAYGGASMCVFMLQRSSGHSCLRPT
jgi:hypothetical protein